ncbi:AAA family ATPase [Faecalibacillus intestinalis]|uniref:AAA family ATPase n=1 Tax=Faecalibacillus intestinalis TaxID=1982626 RepID=UPI00399BADC9
MFIEKKNIPNIFKTDKILNISGVVGENGTGKTTLLNKLGGISDIKLKSQKSKVKKEFIAVFYDDDFVIFNSTNQKIKVEGEVTDYLINYSSSKIDVNLDQLSKVYLTNSNFSGENYYLKLGEIDYINLSSKTFEIFEKDFFSYKGSLNDQRGVNNTKFDVMQSIFPNFMGNRFRSLIDIDFLVYVKGLKDKFIGKDISNIQFKIDKIDDFISSDLKDLNYYTKKYHEKDVKEFEKKFIKLLTNINSNNDITSSLIMNLAGELIYCYPNFNEHIGEYYTIDELYEKCKGFIKEYPFTDSKDNKEKAYFQNAIKEINIIKRNNFEKNGNCYTENIKTFWNFIKNFISNETSFLLKYIHILDEYTSSGERAILNFMSRIYFLSKISKYFKDKNYKLRENILLLIDEIDLYLHPAWQQKIITTLINELNECFPDNVFQIVFSTHSPIVLSDMPTQNCVFLKKGHTGIIMKKAVKQTFGCNIFNLYKDAFFLENGNTFGEYSRTFINNIAKEIKTGKFDDKENINRLIDLIGEPIIQNHLRKLINEPKKIN